MPKDIKSSIAKLMLSSDPISTMWLAWTGKTPTSVELPILSACFIACVDHGEEPPSAQVARTVASCGKPLADSVAAGLLTLGPRHGNAGSAASQWMREALEEGHTADMVVNQVLEEKRRLPGLGHPEYGVDPRTMQLIKITKKHLKKTPHCDFALAVSRVMTKQKGKPLPLNIDGALGAVMADLGAQADLADAIFIAARTIGLIMQAREEAAGSVSYRRG